MKRTIKKQIWMNKKEAEALKKKAKNACLNESTYIRMLVDGFVPRQAPDEKFFEDMETLKELGDSFARKTSGINDAELAALFDKEAKNFHALQDKIEQVYLRPERIDERWQ